MKIDILIEAERGVKLEAHVDANVSSLEQALTTITENLITLLEKSHDERDDRIQSP